MDFLANLALILSAAGMIALAILTYKSVHIMQKSHCTMQKDSMQKNRPFVYVDSRKFKLTSNEKEIHLFYVFLNTGHSPAKINDVEILLNNQQRLRSESIEIDFPIVLFPTNEGVGAQVHSFFDKNSTLRPDGYFKLDMTIEYSSVGFEEIKYSYKGIYDMDSKADENGALVLDISKVRKQITT